ncbi:uncharacterized protein LOC119078349 isoform X2 [Bradysia coprophila]|uniref:uncharacterized protein LOC119078349 isoform X2 n=1 Tax=Bradysia coprophila TaxID=38358 RepID=UPI00187D92CB|nr:uncharacterized protein LOC119078349 isoform X2 [Bradysia coprophila]
MDPMSTKRSLPSEAHGSAKIPKTEEAFEFPKEPTLYSDDVAVEKNLFELRRSFIPFRTAGPGQLLITNELLTFLYEKRENDPDGKVECGIIVFPVPDFEDVVTDPIDRVAETQEYWKNEIGSFISALRETGETVGYIVSPFWYKKFNWNSLYTICTRSSIKYDIYVHLCHDEEYEWHQQLW